MRNSFDLTISIPDDREYEEDLVSSETVSEICTINGVTFYIGTADACKEAKVHRKICIGSSCKCCKTDWSINDLNDTQDEDIYRYFGPFMDYCKGLTEGESVLVHCQQGVSRSPSLLISYIIVTLDMDVPQAISFVQRKRRNVSPNISFYVQLQKWAAEKGIKQ